MRVRFLDFGLDSDRHELTRNGVLVRLPPKVFQLLQILVDVRPKAVSQRDLYDRLWPKTFVEKSNLHNLIYQLRDALDDRDQKIIRTIYGVGFAFSAEVHDATPSVPWQIVIADREFDLREGENVIGRDREASLRINSRSISRRHARITISSAGVILEDLGSKNGTSIRDRRIDSPTEIHDGDSIMFGSVSATLRATDPSVITETTD